MADTLTPLAALDEELRAACAKRHKAFRRMVIKDTPANRADHAEACTELDALLERRHAAKRQSEPLAY